MRSSKNWLLTINSPKFTDKELCEYLTDLEDLNYAIFQREKDDTEHIHLFLVFSYEKKKSEIKELFEVSSILAVSDRQIKTCVAYCSKCEIRIGVTCEIGGLDLGEEHE